MRTGANVMRVVALAMVLLGSAAGCSKTASTDQCTRLLDRLIDQEVAATGGKDLPETMKADLIKQKAALTDAVRADFMKSCTSKAPRAAVECGLTAKSPEDFATCDGN